MCLRKLSYKDVQTMGEKAFLLTPGSEWDLLVDKNNEDEKVPNKVVIKQENNEPADV